MLKIGAVLYGSGYVLLAFLEGDFVDRLGWITHDQLLDAVSVGQVTPGPVFTTATFLGYLVAGLPGAVVATVAIFLPSFVFVGLLTRLTVAAAPRWTSALLDGVNATALALMAGVSLQLAGRPSSTAGRWGCCRDAAPAVADQAQLRLVRPRRSGGRNTPGPAWLIIA